MKLIIGYLYSDLMNIYGDTGNIICLSKRAEWRGIEVEIKHISLKDHLPTPSVGTRVDLYFFGGGQDQSQELVAKDLAKSGKGKIIKAEVERGVPLLSICGGYQLLGDYYQPHEGPKLPGVGLFPAYTVAGNKRMIGNIVINANSLSLMANSQKEETNNQQSATSNKPLAPSNLVGFENHSGKTYLKKGAEPLGKVIKGYGNNGEDKTEGCIYKHAIGCYMHGSLLPKNPALADWLLTKALQVKYKKNIVLTPLDDSLEIKTHNKIIAKFS